MVEKYCFIQEKYKLQASNSWLSCQLPLNRKAKVKRITNKKKRKRKEDGTKSQVQRLSLHFCLITLTHNAAQIIDYSSNNTITTARRYNLNRRNSTTRRNASEKWPETTTALQSQPTVKHFLAIYSTTLTQNLEDITQHFWNIHNSTTKHAPNQYGTR